MDATTRMDVGDVQRQQSCGSAKRMKEWSRCWGWGMIAEPVTGAGQAKGVVE